MLNDDAALTLPDNVASLQAMVMARTEELAEIRTQRPAQEGELAAARAELVEQLELTLADIDEMLGEITPTSGSADEPAEIPARKAGRQPHVGVAHHNTGEIAATVTISQRLRTSFF
jgi:hypothetical protein